MEFVQDKETRQPFLPKIAVGWRYMSIAVVLGVAMYPGMSTIDGTKGDHVLLAPPYNVSESELRDIVEVMKRAYDNFEKEFDVKPTGQLHDLVYP